MDLATWSTVLREFGYPALFTLGTIAAWVVMVRWLKPHAEGMIADHRALVQTTTKSVSETAAIAQRTSQEVATIAESIRTLAASQAQTFRALEQHHDWARGKVLELELAVRALSNKSTS